MQAGILAWILPGAGHYWLGHKKLAAVFFAAISLPYLTGAAIGGVKTTLNPFLNHWLFLAELGVGSYTAAGFFLANSVGGIDARETAAIIRRTGAFSALSPERQNARESQIVRYVSYYPSADVAQIYLAVAGLLNLLAILDAIARAQTGGEPVFYHELATAAARRAEGAA